MRLEGNRATVDQGLLPNGPTPLIEAISLLAARWRRG